MFNNSYIKMGRYNRIAHLIFNSNMTNELDGEVEYLSTLRKVTEINLTNSTQHYVIVSDNFNRQFRNMLHQCSDLNFDVVVIWFEGSWPMGREFEEKLLESVDGEWSENEWLVAGHILDKGRGDAPHFHNQCVVINLKSWNKLASTEFSPYWRSNFFPNYKQSDEHMHDDYTPMYLEPQVNEDMLQLIPTQNKLDVLIPVALENNMRVNNLNWDIRSEKHCCYPEDNVQETKRWLLDQDWTLNRTVDEVNLFGNDLDEDKQELYGFKCMNTHVMYITNTESVPGNETYDCTVMTCPCSGLHQFKHMNNARDTLKRVIWTDFSEAGIWWTKKVLAEWDGIAFNDFYKKHKRELQEKWMAYEANNYDPDLANKFEDSFDSQEQWLEVWDWIRGLDHTFVQVDLVKEWKRIVDMIGTDETVFMQVSNIWQYEINYINNNHLAPQAAFIGMISSLLENNKDVYITGDSPGGVYYNYQNMKELISII